LAYHIEFETRARKEFLDLARELQTRIFPVIEDLAKNPRPPGAKNLSGVAGYRVRKGDYRILYSIDDEKFLVRVYRIGHRREVYR
jgi:mRNA interferase RelE/StbE